MINSIWVFIERVCSRWQAFFVTYFLICTALYGLFFMTQTGVFASTNWGALAAFAWIIFALLAAFGDALVGFIDEYLLHTLEKHKVTTMDAPGKLLLISGFFGGVVAFGAFGGIMFIPHLHFSLNQTAIMWALVAGVIEILWMIPYFQAIHRGGAVYAAPILQSVPLFALGIGVLVFSEIPLLIHVVAAIAIISGGLILNYTPELRTVEAKTVTLMLTSSAIIAVGYFFFKEAAELSNFITAVFFNGVGMLTFTLLIWILYRPYRTQFKTFVLSLKPSLLFAQVGNEALYAGSTIAAQYAIILGPSVMVVTAFNAFHPVFTLLIAGLLAVFGSSVHKHQLSGTRKYPIIIGITSIALGTVLLAV